MIAVGVDQYNHTLTGDASATLGTNTGQSTGRAQVMAYGFKRGQGKDARSIGFGDAAPTLTSSDSGTQQSPGVVHQVAHTLRAEGHDASEDGTGRSVPLVAGTLSPGQHPGGYNGQDAHNDLLVANVLTARMHKGINTTLDEGQTPIASEHGGGWIVRRLTPRECERLQGFPDGHTLIDYRGRPAADGPRYKALGNSMAVNVMSWIGRRLLAVEGGGC